MIKNSEQTSMYRARAPLMYSSADNCCDRPPNIICVSNTNHYRHTETSQSFQQNNCRHQTLPPLLPPCEWLWAYTLFSSPMNGRYVQTWCHPQNWKCCTTNCTVLRVELVMATGKTHWNFGAWTCSFWDILMWRDTDTDIKTWWLHYSASLPEAKWYLSTMFITMHTIL